MKLNITEIIKTLLAKYLSLPFLLLQLLSIIADESLVAQSLPECQLPQFGTIIVDPDIELNGAGEEIDTIEFWKAPDSTETLMFVTAKNNSLVEVWKYPFEGNELQPLTHSTFSNSTVNGVFIDQETDLLYVSIGDPSSTVSVFTLPDLVFQMNFNKAGVNYHIEPNLTLLNLPSGDKNIYVSADDVVYIHNATTGEYIDEFTPEEGLETMAADDFYQRIYIPDEQSQTGIYVYNPDGTPYTNNGSNQFGEGVFDADAEEIIIYKCPLNNPVDIGEGFIVVSDQRSSQTEFEFFDRITWEHLGALKLTGISNTDGIASYPYPLPGYPLGVFAAVDDDHSVAIVGWEKIFKEISSTEVTEDENYIPGSFELNQNYPNPFNPTTKIKFHIPEFEHVKLTVYDVLGKEVRIIVDEKKYSGTYDVIFDANDLPGGIYFYKLVAGKYSGTKKMILLK